MKLGDLYVVLKTSATEFGSGVDKAIAHVDRLAKQVKRATSEMSQAGLGLAAVAAGAVALAATVDKGIAAEVKNLKNAFTDLAVPVAQMVVPAMRELAERVRAVADWVAGLSPHTRQMIGTFVEVAAIVGGSALVIAKVATAIEGLAGVMALITSAPFLVVIAALAAVATAVLFLHKVWRENWGGIQEKVASVVEAISEYWNRFVAFVSGVMSDLWTRLIDGVVGFGKVYASVLVTLGKLTAEQGELMGRAFDWAGKGAKMAGPGSIISVGVHFARVVKDGLVDAGKALKKEFDLIVAGIPSLSNGGHAARHVEAPSALDLGIGSGAQGPSAFEHLNNAAQASAKMLEAVAKAGKIEADWLAASPFRRPLLDLATRLGYAGDAARKFAEGLETVLGSVVSRLASKMGDVGDVINAALQGFQAGGIWGAVIAVIAEVFTKMSFFAKLIGSINEFFGHSLARIDKALSPLFDSIINIAEAIGGLIDVFMMLSRSVEITNGIFRIIGAVINFAALGIMMTVNNILSIIIDIGKAFGANMTAAMKTQADLLVKAGKMVADLKHFDLFDSGGEKVVPSEIHDTNIAIKDLGGTVEKVTDKFNELLTNIPTGYKRLHAAQFGATTAVDTGMRDKYGNPISSSEWNDSPYAVTGSAAGYEDEGEWGDQGGGGGGVTINGNVTVQSNATSLRELAKDITRQTRLELKRSNRNGAQSKTRIA